MRRFLEACRDVWDDTTEFQAGSIAYAGFTAFLALIFFAIWTYPDEALNLAAWLIAVLVVVFASYGPLAFAWKLIKRLFA